MASISVDMLRELLNHMEWGDARVWGAVLGHPAAVEDRRLRDILMHLHAVQRRFLCIWTEQPFDAAAFAGSLEAARPTVRSYYDDLRAAIRSFDETALSRAIVMPGLERYEQQMGRSFDTPTLAETVLQVASHSTYHRGQANARLRELGAEPPLVDYIAWIWFGKPAAEWP